MALLSMKAISLSRAAACLGSENLSRVLGEMLHETSDAVAKSRGRFLESDSDDVLVAWSEGSERSQIRAAASAAFAIVAALEALSRKIEARHPIRLLPRLGLISGDDEGAIRQARFLRKCNLIFGTKVLTDSASATHLGGRFLLRTVEPAGEADSSPLLSPTSLRALEMEPSDVTQAMESAEEIVEVLALQDTDTPEEGRLIAYNGAVEMYRRKEFSRAMTVFELLTAGGGNDRPTDLFLERCKRKLSLAGMC